MTNSSTSGMNGNSTNNFLPNLMHFQNQQQKMFPNLSSPNHNNQGFLGPSGSKKSHFDDMSDVKPSILEMIQEERRAKMLEATQITHNWMAHHAKQQNSATSQSTSSAVGGSE